MTGAAAALWLHLFMGGGVLVLSLGLNGNLNNLALTASATNMNGTSASHNLNLFIINLDRRPERLDTLWETWGEKQWLVDRSCRLSAFDGKSDDSLHEIEAKNMVDSSLMKAVMNGSTFHGEAGIGLTKGGVALFASHASALRRIATDPDIDFGIVVEDDATQFSPNFDRQFFKWRDDVDAARVGVVYFGVCGNEWGDHTKYPKDHAKQVHLGYYRDQKHPRMRFHNDPAYCNHFYGVTKKAAKALLPLLLPMKSNVQYDTAFSRAWQVADEFGLEDDQMEILFYTPPIANQGPPFTKQHLWDSDVQSFLDIKTRSVPKHRFGDCN
mmetsp:Transcript_11554/g.23269  ORF Transcript_11554/g.23269 Transcript_11554/m.23269 type:complete len:326 (-) Transcript_11554:413-1390(-)